VHGDARTYRLVGIAMAVAGGVLVALGYVPAGIVFIAGALVMVALSNLRR
jgi:hypothetical protein